MQGQDCEQLTLFPADSPASLSPLPGSEEAGMMTVISGRKCSALLRNSGPLGLLVKMLLESSVWRSTRCFLTWKPKVTKQGRLWFQLAASTPRTEDTGSPYWPTPDTMCWRSGDSRRKEARGRHAVSLQHAVAMWPTPSASDCGRTSCNPHMTRNGTIRHIGKNGRQSCARLNQVAALFPTPKERDYKDSTSLPPSRQEQCHRDSLAQRIGREEPRLSGGTLNPAWVEWLMGFPIGWTDLDA